MAATRLIEYLGGTEKLQMEAPLVLEFLQKSVEQSSADNYYIGSLEESGVGMDTEGLCDDAKSIFLGVEEAYSDEHGIHTLMRADFGRVQQTIDIVAVLYNVTDERKIVTESKHFDNISYAEFNMFADNEYAVKSLKSALRVEADFTWSEDGKSSKTQRVVFKADEYENGKPIISKIEVMKPRAKDGKRTQVLYDRVPQITEKTDYHYENVLQEGGKSTKIMMPFKGEITVEDGLEIEGILTNVPSESPKLFLLLEKGGNVVYSNEKSFAKQCVISEDKKSISWEIDDNWNQNLNLEHLKIETILDFSCIFVLQVVDPKEPSKIYMPKIMINSVDQPLPYTVGSGALEIEKINLKWGCLAEDTMIEMGDGISKKISSIEIGDVVKTQSGQAAVINIYKGTEEELVCLETTNGHVLRMTKSHPVKTKRGFISADKLTAADVVETVDGDSMVKYLYMQEYGVTVYNLELEPSGAMICNGIIAGDFDMQNSLIQKKKTQCLSELQLEFAKLYKNLNK